jgi:hypothetical protein
LIRTEWLLSQMGSGRVAGARSSQFLWGLYNARTLKLARFSLHSSILYYYRPRCCFCFWTKFLFLASKTIGG